MEESGARELTEAMGEEKIEGGAMRM